MRYKIIILFIILSSTSYSQCAMCKAVVQNGDSKMAESLNSGILYLMIFPYLFLAIGIYLLIKKYKKNKKSVT